MVKSQLLSGDEMTRKYDPIDGKPIYKNCPVCNSTNNLLVREIKNPSQHFIRCMDCGLETQSGSERQVREIWNAISNRKRF